MMRRLLRLGALALAASVVLVGVQETPASARHRRRRPRHPVIQIADQAKLSADRLTAAVVLTVNCSNATPTPIRVSVEQNSVSGSARSGADYKCNNRAQRLVVPVTAASPFHTGGAIATASVTFHSGSSVTNPSSSRGIQLV
jgi:hypothetical protein